MYKDIGIAMANKLKMEEIKSGSMKRPDKKLRVLELEFLYLNNFNIFVCLEYFFYYNCNLYLQQYLCLLSSLTTISLKTK